MIKYYQWMQRKKRQRKINRDILAKKVEKVIRHVMTVEKKVSDFPGISNYLDSKFPDVDLTGISIYVALPDAIDKMDLQGIGGCYVPHMKLILVKSKIKGKKASGKFAQLMCAELSEVDMEDVVVHELIHAVSFSINRASSKFKHMEEEFVYTNCIDFYKQKGISIEDIVNNNFLPFFINDIQSSYKSMSKIFSQTGLSISTAMKLNDSEYRAMINRQADKLVPLIKTEAQSRAYHMIKLYNEYGDMDRTSSAEVINEVSERAASFDWD